MDRTNQLAIDLYNTLAAASKPKQRQKYYKSSPALVDPVNFWLNPFREPSLLCSQKHL